MQQPLINTARCSVRPPAPGDRHPLLELLSSEAVREYLGGVPAQSTVDVKLTKILANEQQNHFSVELIGSGDFAGLISLHRYHDGEHWEFSYQFQPQFWGAGYATETLRAALPRFCAGLKVDHVFAETQAANRRSLALLERLDMIVIKRLVRFGAEQVVYQYTVPAGG